MRVASALDRALDTIPSVRRYQVGRRLRLGTRYEAAAPIDFSYCAIVEFADRAALEAYLRHPAHEELGQLFYETSAQALACDFETVSAEPGAAIARWRKDT